MATDIRESCVVLDSCVLFQAPLRDLLMRLALLDVFRARWSNTIHEEWMRSLQEKRPDLTRARIERTRDLMNAHVLEGMVGGFEHLIPTIHLPDPDDRHVVALAQHCHAEIIVTYNLQDFPQEELGKYGIEAMHPDAFLVACIADKPLLCYKALGMQLGALKNPPMTFEALLHCFGSLSLIRAADAFRRLVEKY